MARERLYGLKEIAAEIRERPATLSAWQTRGTNDMPPPDQRLAAGPVWFASTIEPWIAGRADEGPRSAPALRQDSLRRILRRHLRATALLLEEPPRRPALIARALKDLEKVRADCSRAAAEARGPLARALTEEAALIQELETTRRDTEREISQASAERRRAWTVSPQLDRAHRELAQELAQRAAQLAAAISAWLADHERT